MITPFDLFGAGKYVYSFVPCCKQDKDIELDDGAIRIFLNTRGTNDDEVSQELIDFLHYVENPDEDSVQNSDSQRLKAIHACVSQIKSSEEMGVKYMQRLEEEIRMKEIAQAEGRAEGMHQGILIGVRTLIRTTGMSASDALSAMGIAENEFDKYLSLLETGSGN